MLIVNTTSVLDGLRTIIAEHKNPHTKRRRWSRKFKADAQDLYEHTLTCYKQTLEQAKKAEHNGQHLKRFRGETE